MTPMTEVAGFIYKEMIKNIDHTATKMIHHLYDRSWFDLLAPLEKAQQAGGALGIWKSMVGNRRPWDHKPVIKQTYGDWSYDSLVDLQFNFDIWSNLHYGFIGKCAGLGAWELRAGAGYAQKRAGTNPPGYWGRRAKRIGDADFLAAFDDPMDQEAITLGIELWNQKGRKLTLTELLAEVRARAADLNTQ